MLSYDPQIHRELWHNDKPFVLTIRRRQRKCRGCGCVFYRRADRYVIAHEEQIVVWKNGRNDDDNDDMTILMCAQKLTDASLIYRTVPKTKTSKMKN